MAEHSSLQDQFLDHLRAHQVASTVFLVNGVKLQGVITHFDACALLLRREAHVQLVYKHSISTIMPNVEIQIFSGDAPADAVA